MTGPTNHAHVPGSTHIMTSHDWVLSFAVVRCAVRSPFPLVALFFGLPCRTVAPSDVFGGVGA